MRKAQQSCGPRGILHGLGWGRRGTCGKCGKTPRAKSRQVFFEPLEERALLSLCVWDGGGNNNLWSNAANWQAGVVPSVDDALVFRGTARTQTDRKSVV